MRNRIPYAAKVLTQQVAEQRKKATFEPVDEPDGLGVHRTIKFDKTTSKWLAPLLESISDPRIASAEITEAGYLHVTFVGSKYADDREPFPLYAAEEFNQAGGDE